MSRRRRNFVAVVGIAVIAATAACGAGSHSALRSGALPVKQLTWSSILRHSTDLGPSRAKSLSILVGLRPGGAATFRTWSAAHGLRTSDVTGYGATLTGAATALDSALGVAIREWRSPGGTRFVAARTDAVVPPELAGAVSGFGRISTLRAGGLLFRPPAGIPPNGLTPTDVMRAYNALPLQQAGDVGAGQTVVIFEPGDAFNQKSLDTFDQMFNLPALTPIVNGKLAANDGVETDMDIETVHAIAPGAKIVYDDFGTYATSDSATIGDVVHAAFQDMDKKYPGAIWSASLGFCEFLYFQPAEIQVLDADVATAVSHGTTFFASSGDTGGLDCTPPKSVGDFPGESGKGVMVPSVLAHTTGVGGTTLSVTSTSDYADEQVWTAAVMSQGTGGGVSKLVPRPSWQTGPGVNAQGVDPQFRIVPDIAADADPASGTIVISAGASSHGDPTAKTSGGGTSLSAPMWAGFTALMNSYLEQHGGKAVGFLNPTLYFLANHPPQYPPFHDITLGNNDFYVATPGYDPVTGLGTPNVAYLTQDILAIQKGQKS